eukprot:1195790-Prorocentrum_minimum.AAC.6
MARASQITHLEGGLVVEHLRQQQVEQRPELLQVVLQRGAGEQQAALALEAIEVAAEAAFAVLHALRLVDDDVLPVHFAQLRAVAHDVLVRRHQHVELHVAHLKGQ